MAKKKAEDNRSLKLSEKEESFCVAIVEDGKTPVEAFTENWSIAGKDATRIRYEAKQVQKRENVARYLEQMLFDRQNRQVMDEAFVVDMLKDAALKNKGTTVGIRALELLGKSMGIFKDRQIIDDPTGHRNSANNLFNLARRQQQGEDITGELESLKDDGDKSPDLYDFKVG